MMGMTPNKKAISAIAAAVIFGAAGLGLATCGFSHTGSSDDNIDRLIANARPGTTIVLPTKNYGIITLPARTFTPALRIDARAATFGGIVMRRVSGIEIAGGTIIGSGGRSYGVTITDASRIRVSGMTITGAHRGIVVSQSEDVSLTDNVLTNLMSDGIDVALSRKVAIERNTCRNFRPTLGTYDEAGRLVKDGDHPDCIQAWSRSSRPPTSDLSILDNVIEGTMQGIFLGNRSRDGMNDGGFDRVVVRGNRVTVSMPNGIYIKDGRNIQVTDNIVRTVKGATMPNRRSIAVKASLRLTGENITACNNIVDSDPRAIGTGRCQ